MFEMVRPKGLVGLCHFNNLNCPTVLKSFVERPREIEALSNLSHRKVFSNAKDGRLNQFV